MISENEKNTGSKKRKSNEMFKGNIYIVSISLIVLISIFIATRIYENPNQKFIEILITFISTFIAVISSGWISIRIATESIKNSNNELRESFVLEEYKRTIDKLFSMKLRVQDMFNIVEPIGEGYVVNQNNYLHTYKLIAEYHFRFADLQDILDNILLLVGVKEYHKFFYEAGKFKIGLHEKTVVDRSVKAGDYQLLKEEALSSFRAFNSFREVINHGLHNTIALYKNKLSKILD